MGFDRILYYVEYFDLIMKNTFIILTAIGVIALVGISVSEIDALETNTEYFIDSENMFLIVAVDASNKVTFVDGGIAVNDKWYMFDENNIKIWRTAEQGDSGRIFGRTIQGDLFYAKYEVNRNEGTNFCLLWHDGIKTRIVENSTVEKLFG